MKQCFFDGCNRNIFSNLYCRVHQYLRTDDKWLNKTRNKTVEPRYPIRLPNVSPKQKNTFKSELLYSFGFRSQKEMFDFVWRSRTHVCQLSGIDLESVPKWQHHWIYAHILPKGKYPYFKYKEDNILLLHPTVHTMVDNFTEDMRTKCPNINFDLWFELQQQQKEKYLLFLRENNI